MKSLRKRRQKNSFTNDLCRYLIHILSDKEEKKKREKGIKSVFALRAPRND